MSKLKEKRLEVGFSQAQLAKKAGINMRTLQHYEQDNSPKTFDNARIDTILRVCLALNCKVSDVIEKQEYVDLINRYENL